VANGFFSAPLSFGALPLNYLPSFATGRGSRLGGSELSNVANLSLEMNFSCK